MYMAAENIDGNIIKIHVNIECAGSMTLFSRHHMWLGICGVLQDRFVRWHYNICMEPDNTYG